MRRAVYAGSFDPPTLGHLSVIEKASSVFEHLYVVVGDNPSKNPTFSVDERVAFLAEHLERADNVSVTATQGLIVDFAKEHEANYLVRGIRGRADAEVEMQLAAVNDVREPSIQTVFLPANPRLREVSSSRLKEMARVGQDGVEYCAPKIWTALVRRVVETDNALKVTNGS